MVARYPFQAPLPLDWFTRFLPCKCYLYFRTTDILPFTSLPPSPSSQSYRSQATTWLRKERERKVCVRVAPNGLGPSLMHAPRIFLTSLPVSTLPSLLTSNPWDCGSKRQSPALATPPTFSAGSQTGARACIRDSGWAYTDVPSLSFSGATWDCVYSGLMLLDTHDTEYRLFNIAGGASFLHRLSSVSFPFPCAAPSRNFFAFFAGHCQSLLFLVLYHRLRKRPLLYNIERAGSLFLRLAKPVVCSSRVIDGNWTPPPPPHSSYSITQSRSFIFCCYY